MSQTLRHIAEEHLLEAEYFRICQLEEIADACRARGETAAFLDYAERIDQAAAAWIEKSGASSNVTRDTE